MNLDLYSEDATRETRKCFLFHLLWNDPRVPPVRVVPVQRRIARRVPPVRVAPFHPRIARLFRTGSCTS